MTMESKRTDSEEYELQFRWKMSFSTVCKVCDILDKAVRTLQEFVDKVVDILKHFTERLIEAFNHIRPTIEEIKEVYSYPHS